MRSGVSGGIPLYFQLFQQDFPQFLWKEDVVFPWFWWKTGLFFNSFHQLFNFSTFSELLKAVEMLILSM